MKRKCPTCGDVLSYSNTGNLRKAIRNKCKCRSCAQIGYSHSDETKRKMSESLTGNQRAKGSKRSEAVRRKIGEANKRRVVTEETRRKIGEGNKRRVVTEETRRKMSEAHRGKVVSDETRRRLRLARLGEIEKKHGVIFPNYNPTACKLIEEYGKKHGYNFQHAENGGEFYIKELGYWVDGYDEEKNVVIEIDEWRHYQNGKLKQKDVRRQREITEHLDCEFIRVRT